MRLLFTVAVISASLASGCAKRSTPPAAAEPVDGRTSKKGEPVSKKDKEIRALVERLDDDPDELHNDMTPAVGELAKLGPAVIPHLRDALLSTEEMTRLHAQRALEQVLYRHLGFKPGAGWQRPGGEAEFRKLWKGNGSYDYLADEDARRASVDAWMSWHAARAK